MIVASVRTEPAFGFMVIALIIIIGPPVAQKLRLPGLIGLWIGGALVDPSVMFPGPTLRLALGLSVALIVGKAAAAWITGRLNHFSTAEVGLMFSLSAAQAQRRWRRRSSGWSPDCTVTRSSTP